MTNQFLSSAPDTATEFKSGILKVRGKTLIAGNSIYYIPNISSLNVIDLSTTKPTPVYFWVMLVIGIACLAVGPTEIKFIGILVLALLGWLSYNHQKNKESAEFGLRIIMNAGFPASPILLSNDQDFLKKVALTLYNIMNRDDVQAVNFNFDQRQISETNIENVSRSTIVTGSVTGDVVNSI